MIVYADSSALIRCYLEEDGSDVVRNCMEEAQLRMTSALTHLELVSAIEFSKRIRRINSPQYRNQIAALNMDFNSGALTLMDVSPAILKRAISIIRVHRLKSPDAIQLSSALEGWRRHSEEIVFLCADHALLDAAKSEGLKCRDVSRGK